MGLQQGEVLEDLHGTQELEVLHIRQLLGDWRQVDRVRLGRQHGLHLEPANQGDRAEVGGTH